MEYTPINLQEKLAKFTELWSPKVIAEMNDYQFKLVKVQGDFVWHKHEDTDEVFMVIEGNLTIEFRDGEVKLNQGEMFVIPRNVEHKPYAESECKIMLVEPKGVVNTGEKRIEQTAENDVWI
ncbi:cupin domain-containing protein [Priestia megaterium]|uniref:cupin domain-containing protein n=1 Tax=Priestia megaterium TaxID=1404 RepID=UPI001B3A3A1F|nr:cupin domain-containing protein [Priestia megaterium]MBQ4869459.1 cupin domain-containing protein [Priestia megaterium]MEB2277486.1 cupin domain-containing protein [Bacillus sp. ILBB4]